MSRRDRFPHLLICLLIAVGLFLGSSAALAQGQEDGDVADEASETTSEEEALDEDEEEIGDIITVTANRRKENIQDTAISVTALSETFIKDLGLTNFNEVQKFAPNLTIFPTTDSRSTSISIRGIGSIGSNAGIDPTVAVFIDGIYQGRAGMSVQDLLDVQSVEVLRGPQGTLYGKNTAAGAIKVQTKNPGYDRETEVEFIGGNYENLEGRFTTNHPIIDDEVATRFSGYYVTRDGFEINKAAKYDGDEVNDVEKWGLRNKTLWDINDDTSLLFSGDYSKQSSVSMVAAIQEYGSQRNFVPLFPVATEVSAYQGIPLTSPNVGNRDVYANEKPDNDVEVGGAAIEGTHERWEHTFTSLTAYRKYKTDTFLDGDFSELDVSTWDTEVDYDQISTELRAVSPAWDLGDYIGGLYVYYSNLQTDDTLLTSEAYMTQFGFCCGDQSTTGDNRHRTTSVAAYGDGNLNLSELWENSPDIVLTGGVRVGWEEKAHKGSHVNVGPMPPVLDTPISGPNSRDDQSKEETYVTGRAVLKYKPTETIMAYASFANGFKSGGYNQLKTSGGHFDASRLWFDPEKSNSFEVGIKTTWLDRMLTFNITGYYTDYEDFQTQTFDGSAILVDNADGFTSMGFEADLTIVPFAGWITVFGVGYTHTKYDDYDHGPCQQPDLIDGSCIPGNNPGQGQDLTDKRRANTPRLNMTLFSAYQQSLPWWDVDWFGQLDYQYMSRRYLDTDLDAALKTDRTNLLGLRTGLREPGGTWEVSTWVKNVTDEDWETAGFDVPLLNGYAVVLAPPRTYGLTIRAKF